MLIFSFDAVLRQPRSLHSIELMPGGKRVPLWRPIPWISIIYFAAVLVAVVAVDNVFPIVSAISSAFVPLIGTEPRLAAFLLCYIALPAGIVYVATNAEIDGRAPHRWVISLGRFFRRPKRTWAGRTVRKEGSKTRYRGKMRFWWDLAAPRLQHGWARGGSITCEHPVSFAHSLRHQKQVIRPDENGILVRGYDVGAGIEVRP